MLHITAQRRIILILDYLGINAKALTEKLGYPHPQIIYDILSNKTKNISHKMAAQIKSVFPEFNLAWLLTGEGEMLIGKTWQEKIRTLPLVPIDASAGGLSVELNGTILAQCEQYAVPEFIDSGAQLLIRVMGDSMLPRYNSGDIVAIREVQDKTFFQWGKIYVLDTNKGVLIKRLYEDKENPQNVICHSENTEVYRDFTLLRTDIRALYLVVGVIRIRME